MFKLWNAVLVLAAVLAISACGGGNVEVNAEGKEQELVSRAVGNQVFIEGGTFIMGDFGAVQDGQWLPYFPPTAERNKAHKVELTSFSLSAYETTWGDYDTYSLIHGKPIVIRGGGEERPREPYMENLEHSHDYRKPALVTWQEAKDYCRWLAERTDIPFDLPTSAQWEFAARNRGETGWLYPTHDGKEIPDEDRRNGEGCIYWTSVCSVGTNLPPNPLGLYDMAANEEEWVEDWYSDTYYRESDGIRDPLGPAEGTEKVIRSVGAGSLSFSFSHTSSPALLKVGYLGLAGFRCAVRHAEPIN